LTVLAVALGGGNLTGAVMNPARAFGPALVSGDWHTQAAYWVGPLIGAALAALAWKFQFLPKNATDLR
jgi:glycerol uptake facilitator-like aquaporin